MDILLDIEIAIESFDLDGSNPLSSEKAISLCRDLGFRVWLYVGSLQTLEYRTCHELSHTEETQGKCLSHHEVRNQARALIRSLSEKAHWLSALASEAELAPDLDLDAEQIQLLNAVKRIARGEVVIITRSDRLLEYAPELTLTPERYLELNLQPRSQPFSDLATQQDKIRPGLEAAIHSVLHHGKFILGPEVALLEQQLSEYVGVAYCITCANGTDALQIALMALDIQPGDEVIIPAFSYIATAEAASLLGATPVFVDIDPKTFNIDPTLLEQAITEKTRAVIPVSLFGQCAQMSMINEVAKRHGVRVIEDAAQSFGATYRGRRSCSLSEIATTSFFPAKPLGCYGDGGAIFTNDERLAMKLRRIARHGQTRRYYHEVIGVNSRMDTVQAAILIEKLKTFENEIRLRENVATYYSDLITESELPPHLSPRIPTIGEECVSSWAQYTVRVRSRDSVFRALEFEGIPAAIYYPLPLNRQPALLGSPTHTPKSDLAAKEVLSLPMHPWISQDRQRANIEALRQALLDSAAE